MTDTNPRKGEGVAKSGHTEHQIVIHIEDKQYKTTATELKGAEIRALAQPPVAADRDLILEIPGPGDDRIIKDSESVTLKNGMHFYSAPRDINPGR
jgi:hypothetical protein